MVKRLRVWDDDQTSSSNGFLLVLMADVLLVKRLRVWDGGQTSSSNGCFGNVSDIYETHICIYNVLVKLTNSSWLSFQPITLVKQITNLNWSISQPITVVKYILVICLTTVIGWKLNQFGMVNLTNILVDMCLTNILVKSIGYLLNQCDWLQT